MHCIPHSEHCPASFWGRELLLQSPPTTTRTHLRTILFPQRIRLPWLTPARSPSAAPCAPTSASKSTQGRGRAPPALAFGSRDSTISTVLTVLGVLACSERCRVGSVESESESLRFWVIPIVHRRTCGYKGSLRWGEGRGREDDETARKGDLEKRGGGHGSQVLEEARGT
jgi:hypothetical protein